MTHRIAIALALVAFGLAPSEASDTVKVTRVVDGDTFVIDSGEKVRLIGVDTPESVHPKKEVEYFGKEASRFLNELIGGQYVRLEYDWQRNDRYNRILAYVFLLNGTFVNAEIIKQGYGHAYVKYPFKQEFMDSFREFEADARDSGRGLWHNELTGPPTD